MSVNMRRIPSRAEDPEDIPNEPDQQTLIERMKDLTERVQELEAEKSLSKQLPLDTQAYVNDLKGDLNAIRRTRFCGVVYSLAYVTAINLLLGLLIWFFPDYFKSLSPYTQTVFIICTISSTITVLIAVLRGTFKTYNERHKEDFLPPHLQAALKILSELQKTRDKTGL